jgi:hypothetical protein
VLVGVAARGRVDRRGGSTVSFPSLVPPGADDLDVPRRRGAVGDFHRSAFLSTRVPTGAVTGSGRGSRTAGPLEKTSPTVSPNSTHFDFRPCDRHNCSNSIRSIRSIASDRRPVSGDSPGLFRLAQRCLDGWGAPRRRDGLAVATARAFGGL